MLTTGLVGVILSIGLLCNGTGLGRAALLEIEHIFRHIPAVSVYEDSNAWFLELTGPCEPGVTPLGFHGIYQQDIHQKIFQNPLKQLNPDVYGNGLVDC